MSNFTAKEIEYIQSQRLGRLATVNEHNEPQIAPVGFRFNADLDVIEISGFNMSKSKKFRNLATNPNVSFVIDDVLPPWQPRGVEVRGIGEAIEHGGGIDASYTTDDAFIRVKPQQIIGWGLDTDAYKPLNRKIEQS